MQTLRRAFATTARPSAVQKQSLPAEQFDELKAFLMEPATQGEAMERARAIVSMMMEQHVFASMPGQEATVMVMVADAMEDFAFVIQVYACLRDAHVSPSPLTLELTAVACAARGDWKTATEVVECMHEAIDVMHPSSEIYENAIAACARANKWMKAKQFLDEMRTYGLEASAESHMQCLALCVAANELTATKTLLVRYLDAFEFEPEDVTETLTELFDHAIAAAALDHALFLRDELLQRSGSDAFDQTACAALVQLCAVQRKWHTARTVLAQFHGAAPPRAPHSSQYTRDIRALLGDLERYGFACDRATYNAALRNLGQLSKHADSQHVFAAMKQRGIEPDAVAFAAAIAACGTDVAAADALVQEMTQRGCAPSMDAYHASLLVPSRACNWSDVLERYDGILTTASDATKRALEQDARILSLVAVAYGRLQEHARMLQVFTSMKVRGVQPNLYVYGEAMLAYIHMDQWRHALLLFDHIHQEGFEPRKLAAFSMIWDAAVLAAVTGEQLERAASLFSTIVNLRASISPHTAVLLVDMLQDVPVATLWDAFRPMAHLHRVRKSDRAAANNNPKVLNAVLKRAVDARDVYFAEKLVMQAEDELALTFNSMTYSLMLRLYAAKADADEFALWCGKMAHAGVKVTVFTFRAVLQHLETLRAANATETDVPVSLDAIDGLLALNLPDEWRSGDCVERIGALVLDSMERRGLAPDALCFEAYLRLSSDPQHATRVLSALERAEDFQYSSTFLHALFVTLGNHADSARVRALLVKCLDDLPRELSDDALAAFCSSSSRDHALALLEALLATEYELSDEQVVLFLVSIVPSVDDNVAVAMRNSSSSAVARLVALLKASEAPLESGSMAFLIQQVVGLSRLQQQRSDSVVARDLDAMQDLLVHALSAYSLDQVHEFLSQVVAQADFVHIESVLRALERR